MQRLLLVLPFLLVAVPASAKKAVFDVKSVKSVAIIAFGGGAEINATETKTGFGPVDAAKNIKEGVDSINALADGSAKSQACQQADEAYDTVANGLTASFGWNLSAKDTVSADGAYSTLRGELVGDGGLNKMGENWCSGWKPQGLLHPDRILSLKQDKRDPLFDALGVEAIAVTKVTVSGEDQGVSVGGIGTSRVKPQAMVQLTIYKKGEKKPVLKTFAVGKKTEDPIKGDFGNSDPNEWKVVLQSVDLGMQKLTEKLTGS